MKALFLCLTAMAVFAGVVLAQDSASPSTQPAATARISPQAQPILDRMQQAYAQLNSLQVTGQISVDVTSDDRAQKLERHFAGAFQAPNKFRHEFQDQLVLGSTGEKAYVFSKGENIYVSQDAPEGRFQLEQLPAPSADLLQAQNPSLLFAIQQDPLAALKRSDVQVDAAPDVVVDGTTYPAVTLSGTPDQPKFTLLIDPKTNLLRRISADTTASLQRSGVRGVQSARFQIDYTTSTPDVNLPADHFAWSPPADARDARAAAQGPVEAELLVGKPAPDFTLSTPDGKSVRLSDLKGHVVVLDFWATWCPPCIEALPKVAELHRGDPDIRVFAVNREEDRQTVQSFLQERHLDLPVLLDLQGEVTRSFNIEGLPQTVVIGPDGIIKYAFRGISPTSFTELKQQIAQAKQTPSAATPAGAKQP